MKIPVFVSSPTALNTAQTDMRSAILGLIEDLNMEPRALGRSDYPIDLPLREVLVIARHCSGGMILGYSQFTSIDGVSKQGTPREASQAGVKFPTPWNHLEAGILYSLGLPLVVLREEGITGGIFDAGVSDVFVHTMPNTIDEVGDLKEVMLRWRARVDSFYYDFRPRGRN
jgi:hypothetical protein